MSKSEWLQFPEEFRKTVISLFRIQGVDFETVFIGQGENSLEMQEAPYMTRGEAAAFARVSKDTVDNWCQKGYVDKMKLGGGKAGAVLISRESLIKFIRRCSMKQRRVRTPYPQGN